MQRIFHNSAKSPRLRELTESESGSWLHLEAPNPEELGTLAKEQNLDIDLLNDGVDPNESPRIEREEGNIYLFTRYCLPEKEQLTTSPLLIVITDDMVITVSRRTFADLTSIVNQKGIFTSKRAQLVLQILSVTNLGFKQRTNRASRRIWELRSQLNKAHMDSKDLVTFIDIEEDLNDFLLVLEPMGAVLDNLLNGRFMRLYDDDKDLIEDLSLGTQELTTLARSRLNTIRNIREAYTTIATNDLNRIFKILTTVSIVIALFNVVTGFYGMNVPLPNQHQHFAYLYILASMGVLATIVILIFRKKRWL